MCMRIILLYTAFTIKKMCMLKKTIIDKILGDPYLFSLVAKKMNVRPVSLITILKRNGNKINGYEIIMLIADYLNINPSDVVDDKRVKIV